MSRQKFSEVLGQEYQYTIIFSFEEKEQMNVTVLGQAIIPTFKLSQKAFNFGDCCVNDKNDIQFRVSNENPNLQLNIDFDKQGYFAVTPRSVVLPPLSS